MTWETGVTLYGTSPEEGLRSVKRPFQVVSRLRQVTGINCI